MATFTKPPAELAQAIKQAAAKYGVPADLLTGIWRVESGSTYPNPAVNSSGYGGLFGTRDAFGSTQDQADLAASVLGQGFKASGGNVAGALSYYNSGRTTGGYTSVPGQSTFGSWNAATGVSDPGSIYQQPARPGSASSVSFLGSAENAAGGLAAAVEGPASLFSSLLGGATDIGGAFKFIGWLLSPKHWAMVLETLVGVALIFFGLFQLGSGEGEDVSPREILTPFGAGKAARKVTRGIGKVAS